MGIAGWFYTAMLQGAEIPGFPRVKVVDGQFFRQIPGGVWSPVFTLPRNEKKLCGVLAAEGVPVYLPLRRHVNIQPVISKGKNYCYKRVLHVPMFPGYVFVNVTPELRTELRRSRSVIRILDVGEGREEVLINELNLIRSLEKFSEDEEIDVAEGIRRGKRVKFIGGAFAGWEGVVLSVDGRDGMVSVNITSIDTSVCMKYPAAWCELCE